MNAIWFHAGYRNDICIVCCLICMCVVKMIRYLKVPGKMEESTKRKKKLDESPIKGRTRKSRIRSI